MKGRERIYLDRFYNEFSADPSKWTEAARNHYAELYASPGAMRAAFDQFAAFSQDAKDNQELLAKAASSPCRCWPSAATIPTARRWRRWRDRGLRRAGTGHRQQRPLADGGTAHGHRGGAQVLSLIFAERLSTSRSSASPGHAVEVAT